MIYNGNDQVLSVLVNEEYVRMALVEDYTWGEEISFLSGVTRLTGGWDVNIPLSQSFTVSVRAVLTRDIIENDALVKVSLDHLRVSKRDGRLVNFRIDALPQGHIRLFKGYISSISEASPSGGFVKISLTILGEGEPTEVLFSPGQEQGVTPWTFDTADTFDSAHTIWND